MGNPKGMGVFLALCATLALSSCGGGGTNTTTPQVGQASIYTIGTDAPLPSVVSCEVNVTGISLNNGGTAVSVLAQPAIVDFAQLSGLHQLLDLTAVPTGTYTSATITIASPVIGFIDTSASPPIVNTINGTLTQSTVTVTFAQPVTVTNADLFGLRMEFDLRQSLQTDGNGQVTGMVDPVFEVALLDATNSQVSIDDFHGGVVGVTGANTFTIQGPHGRQWTVETGDSTVLDDPTMPISSFTTSTIVEVSGTLDPVSHDIVASEIEVVSNDSFYLGGLFTNIRPTPGAATQADLYVRDELPAINGISDGQIETLNLNGSENYLIEHIHLPLTTLLFNNSELAAGQRVGLGGALSTANGVTTLTVHRVVLKRQGQAGTWVPGSTMVQNNNAGTFQLTDNWTAGVLLPAPLTVMTTNDTNFINLSGLSALQGTTALRIRVVGFIIVNQATGQPVMVARSVEQLSS
ncbi:MAG TPA: DUF4382 domain-containing protein [Candidatus Acidoferrales bacterium]